MVWRPDYITTVQLRDWERIADTVDDATLAVAITAASRAVDDYCNRQFGSVASEARTYRAVYDYGRGVWCADVDDFQSVVGMAVVADGAAATGLIPEPRNAVLDGKAFTTLRFDADAWLDDDEVTVTLPWGWTTVPTSVTFATRLQASRFAARRDSPYGIAGSPDGGGELRLLTRVDADVAVGLRGYRRSRLAR